ncbi:MAG: hypothetical protein WC117_07240, partial [Sphaerochaetaceae bacterium]
MLFFHLYLAETEESDKWTEPRHEFSADAFQDDAAMHNPIIEKNPKTGQLSRWHRKLQSVLSDDAYDKGRNQFR